MKNITLQKIEITNFRGYFGGPHIFSFDDDSRGSPSESRVFHIQGISGRGKTTLLRAILHAFFGIHNPLPNQLKSRASTLSKSKSRLEMKKAKGMSCGHVRLFFYSAVLEAQCIIDRKSNPSILKISVNGKEYSGDVQRLITEEILCLTETQFSLSSYLVQGKHNSLLSLSSSEKFRFIEEILYDEESSPSKLKEKILELKNETLLKVAEIEHEYEVQTRLLKNFNAKKESLSENLSPEALSSSVERRGDTSTTEIDEKITNLNSKLKKIRNSITSTKAKLAEFSKLENALSKIDITYAEKVDFLSEIQTLEEEGKEVNELVKLIRKYELRISKAQSSVNEIEELLEETTNNSDVGTALEISRELYFLILFERVVCTLFYSFRKRAPKDVMLIPEGKMSPPVCISKTDLPSLKELKKFRDSLIGALTTSDENGCATVENVYDLALEFLHSLPSSIRKSIGEDTSLAHESVYAPLFSFNDYGVVESDTTTPSCTYELNEGVFNGELEIQCRWCNGTIIVNSNEPAAADEVSDVEASGRKVSEFPEPDVFFPTLFEKFEEIFSLDSLREARFSPLETKASFKHFDVKDLVSQIDFSRSVSESNEERTMSNLLKTRYEKAKSKLKKVTREFEEDERLSVVDDQYSNIDSLEKRGSRIRKSISDLEKRKTLHEVYLSKVKNISLRAEEIGVEFDSESLSFPEKTNEKFENELSMFREKGEKVGKKIETLREIKANLALISHLSEIQESITESTNALKTLSSQLTSLREKLYSQEILLEILKKSKMESIESTLSALNSLAAKFIPLFFKVSGKSVKVALSSSTTTSRGEVRNKISVSVVSEGVTFDSYTDLSEGERQRIEFAYILAVNMYLGSPFLIIDECLNGVDQFTKQDILETLNSYSKENDVDVFITGHELNDAVIDTIIEL